MGGGGRLLLTILAHLSSKLLDMNVLQKLLKHDEKNFLFIPHARKNILYILNKYSSMNVFFKNIKIMLSFSRSGKSDGKINKKRNRFSEEK